MLTAALFTIATIWKQPKCQSTDEWIKRTWHIYILEHYINGPLKRKEILPFEITWMDQEDIMLSEICQSQKRKDCTILLI